MANRKFNEFATQDECEKERRDAVAYDRQNLAERQSTFGQRFAVSPCTKAYNLIRPEIARGTTVVIIGLEAVRIGPIPPTRASGLSQIGLCVSLVPRMELAPAIAHRLPNRPLALVGRSNRRRQPSSSRSCVSWQKDSRFLMFVPCGECQDCKRQPATARSPRVGVPLAPRDAPVSKKSCAVKGPSHQCS